MTLSNPSQSTPWRISGQLSGCSQRCWEGQGYTFLNTQHKLYVHLSQHLPGARVSAIVQSPAARHYKWTLVLLRAVATLNLTRPRHPHTYCCGCMHHCTPPSLKVMLQCTLKPLPSPHVPRLPSATCAGPAQHSSSSSSMLAAGAAAAALSLQQQWQNLVQTAALHAHAYH